MDPEAAKIVITAPFPEIIVAGNVANQVHYTEEWLAEVTQVDNYYTRWLSEYLDLEYPCWDELAIAIMVDPSLITNATYRALSPQFLPYSRI